MVTTTTERPGHRADPVVRRAVLIAHGEDRVRSLVADILRDIDVEVIEAHDGRHALEAARRERPLLVLLDTVMPVLDGLEVCRGIRTDPALAATVVVMLTAQGQRDT